MRRAPADLEGPLSQIARFRDSLCVDRSHNDVDGVFLKSFQFSEMLDRHKDTIDIKSIEALALRPTRDIGVKTLARLNQRRQHFQWSAPRSCLDLSHDRRETLFFDRQIAIRTELRSGLGKKESKKMIDFRYCRYS